MNKAKRHHLLACVLMMIARDLCPKCSQAPLYRAYGLMGGGIGGYEGCDACGYFRKEQDREGMEGK